MGKANINIKRGEQCKLRIMEREIIVSCTIVAPTCTLYQSTTKIVWQLSVLEQIKETKSSRHNKIDINIKRHSMPLPTKRCLAEAGW